MMTNANTTAADQFLVAYAERPNVRVAARAAGVHWATVYRWRASNPVFAARWAAIDEAHHQAGQRQYQIEEAQRQAARARRLEELRPIYQANAAHAREMKRRRRGW